MSNQGPAVKVAVTEPEFQKAEDVFSRAGEGRYQCVRVPGEEVKLAAALRQHAIAYVIIGVEAYRGPLYEALPPGGVIARFGVGHDGVDKRLATERRLWCTNTPGVLDDSVAEHAIGLLLALARHTPAQANGVRVGEWSPQMGVELKGKRLAVLGYGRIGRRVAWIAARGFRMEVVGLSRVARLPGGQAEDLELARPVTSFDEAVREADFVSLHLPSGPATHHYLDRARLARLPADCFLINTARGALVDELALFDALASGRLAGAALDVFEQEPYRPQAPDKDLRRLASVILTPHIGSSTREACDRMAERALRNIQLAMAGQYAEMDLLNPQLLAQLGADPGK